MTGTMKKIDAQGFGIIDGADGSKVSVHSVRRL